MNKNYFELKEKKQELKCLHIVLCDLLLLIEHCIKYNIQYDEFKKLYLDLDNRYDVIYKKIKDLESDD